MLPFNTIMKINGLALSFNVPECAGIKAALSLALLRREQVKNILEAQEGPEFITCSY